MVLLSSPFWVAWLAVILNQQGGLSGAEGSEEEELCVCLFVVLHCHFLSIFALLFYAFTFEMFSVFCTGFSFCKMFDSIACVFSPYILWLSKFSLIFE